MQTRSYSTSAKADALNNFYQQQFGSKLMQLHTLNWDLLQLVRHDLHDLDRDIMVDEIHVAVTHTADEKSSVRMVS
jgi:hypothetical protein